MSSQGPFRRPRERGSSQDSSARFILLGMGAIGLLLLILVLPPISLLSDGDFDQKAFQTAEGGASGSAGGEGNDSNLPNLPDGLEALSPWNRNLDDNGAAGPFLMTVKLSEPVADGRNLGLYTYANREWTRIASGTLAENGVDVQAEVATIPDNVVVLRRVSTAAAISGWLAPGAQPDAAGLQVMDTLNPLGVVPAPDGNLAGAQADVGEVQAQVIPTVRAGTPEEIEAVNAIVASPALREAHANALVQLALAPGNAGVDIDYRNVDPARGADFTAFVTLLGEKLRQADRLLHLTLPAPSKTGVAWDTGAYDWTALSRQADRIKLAAEVDPSIYYQRMEEVLTYLEPQVDMSKVSLIVTRQSVEKGTDGLVRMSLHDALTIASAIEVRTTATIVPSSSVVIVGKNIFLDDGASGIVWDEEARAVSFSYPGAGGQRTVWMENSLSLAFRLDLARRFDLGGIAVESLAANPGAPDVWGLLQSYAETGSVDLVAPNDVMLRPTWQAQAGSSEAGAKGNVVWRAPAQPGEYEVALIVSDGVIRAQQKITLNVQAGASGTAP